MKGQAEGGAMKPELKELKIDPRPAPPYRARVKMADKETQVTPERESVSLLHSSFYVTLCSSKPSIYSWLLFHAYLVTKLTKYSFCSN